jgi:hypothetical protein
MQHRFGTWSRVALPVVVMGFALSAWASEHQTSCSNATLRGGYSFSINGGIQTPEGVLEIHGVALTHFDGEGSLSNTDHLVRNGTPPPVEWRPGTGTYMVNENCTGELHIINESSPQLDLYFVIAGQGLEIRGVVSDPGANISANGLKVHLPL